MSLEEKVKELIVQQLGVSESEVVPEAKLLTVGDAIAYIKEHMA